MSFGPSQFAGGAFMDRHADGGLSKEPETQVSDTMRSLTINQLSKAQQQAQGSLELICDGRTINQVSIVGLITGKFRGESCNLLTVYDGTGTIEVKQFTDHENDDLQEQQNQLVENMYVRVYGSFRGQRDDGPPGSLGQINSFSIRPVEDHNEVVHHQLDVIFQHLYLTQSQNMPGAGNVAGWQGGFGGMAMPGAHAGMGGPMGGSILQPQGGAGMSAAELVRDLLKDRGIGVPVPLGNIVSGLNGQLTTDEVKAALAELESKGLGYHAQLDQYAAC